MAFYGKGLRVFVWFSPLFVLLSRFPEITKFPEFDMDTDHPSFNFNQKKPLRDFQLLSYIKAWMDAFALLLQGDGASRVIFFVKAGQSVGKRGWAERHSGVAQE